MQTFLCEIQVPDDCDPSELLERIQNLAVEIAEDFQEDSENFLDEEAIRDACSVQESCQAAA